MRDKIMNIEIYLCVYLYMWEFHKSDQLKFLRKQIHCNHFKWYQWSNLPKINKQKKHRFLFLNVMSRLKFSLFSTSYQITNLYFWVHSDSGLGTKNKNRFSLRGAKERKKMLITRGGENKQSGLHM